MSFLSSGNIISESPTGLFSGKKKVVIPEYRSMRKLGASVSLTYGGKEVGREGVKRLVKSCV